MKILVVAATYKEIELCSLANDTVDYLITGVGLPASVFKLTEHLQSQNYDLVINAGIAGSYIETDVLGRLYHVTKDCFADIGFQDHQDFIPLSESPFANPEYTIESDYTDDFLQKLPQAKGISVNTVSGNTTTVEQRKKLFNPDVESMEGAAILYTCKQMKVPSVQIRSISNYVEERNTEKWNIKLAIAHLNHLLIDYISFLEAR